MPDPKNPCPRCRVGVIGKDGYCENPKCRRAFCQDEARIMELETALAAVTKERDEARLDCDQITTAYRMADDEVKAKADHMVNRFLGWKLPEDFHPDAGISFKRDYSENTPWPQKHEPTGTNLFDASQATTMVRYMMEGAPSQDDAMSQLSASQAEVATLRGELEEALACNRGLAADQQPLIDELKQLQGEVNRLRGEQ